MSQHDDELKLRKLDSLAQKYEAKGRFDDRTKARLAKLPLPSNAVTKSEHERRQRAYMPGNARVDDSSRKPLQLDDTTLAVKIVQKLQPELAETAADTKRVTAIAHQYASLLRKAAQLRQDGKGQEAEAASKEALRVGAELDRLNEERKRAGLTQVTIEDLKLDSPAAQ